MSRKTRNALLATIACILLWGIIGQMVVTPELVVPVIAVIIALAFTIVLWMYIYDHLD